MDDDPGVLKALTRLLRTRPMNVKTYGSSQEFLAALSGELPECLIVDLQMPEMSSLDLLQHLMRSAIRIPAIVITAHSAVGMRDPANPRAPLPFL